ncbi:MAG: hypothetical protein WC692_12495 [Erythrobacter sp.]
MSVLELLGLAPSERDRRMKELVAHSYQKIEVVGRGTIKIDPEEVRSSKEFRDAREKARLIVQS